MADKFANQNSANFLQRMGHPISNADVITKSDSTDIINTTRGLYVGVAGDVKVTLDGGDTVTLKALAAGVVHPFRVKRVWATGTTATDIPGLY